jgi:hypothetical protein
VGGKRNERQSQEKTKQIRKKRVKTGVEETKKEGKAKFEVVFSGRLQLTNKEKKERAMMMTTSRWETDTLVCVNYPWNWSLALNSGWRCIPAPFFFFVASLEICQPGVQHSVVVLHARSF